jgi:hypothetical protein
VTRLTVVFGERADLAELALEGALWVEDLPGNRALVEPLWEAGSAATLFRTKDLIDVLADADLHELDWQELRVLRAA